MIFIVPFNVVACNGAVSDDAPPPKIKYKSVRRALLCNRVVIVFEEIKAV